MIANPAMPLSAVADEAPSRARLASWPAYFLPEQMAAIRWSIYVSLSMLAVGGLFGLFQAIERLGVDPYPSLPVVSNYYQGLSIHGVALVLVFTFAFSNGFLALTTVRSLERPLASTLLMQASVGSLVVGVILAVWALLANEATVLFTFYPPLKAHPLFYLGLVLVVISTWLVLLVQALTLREWHKEHPGQRAPLMAYLSVVSYVMWFICSLGVAVEILVFLLPWSMGLLPFTDPEMDRTLFWFTGHPIVYAWLLPAYISWYTMLPKQVGGRVFSDPLARLVFMLFLVLSVPIGVHHQYTDAGITETQKTVAAVLTFAVFFPSVITAFSVIGSLERAGRARGGLGLFGWIPRLPWGDPGVSAQLLSGLVFFLGGATGLVNASYTMNLVVHNTAFIPGHFHLTVGTAVALTIMGVCYWLVPLLTTRALWGRWLAVAQTWLWAIGVLIFSRGQIAGGLVAMPRRTAIATAPYANFIPEWGFDNFLAAIGGFIMVVSGVLFFVVMVGTLMNTPETAQVEVPVADADPEPARASRVWPILDNWGLWIGITVALTAAVYGPVFASLFPLNMTSPGVRLW